MKSNCKEVIEKIKVEIMDSLECEGNNNKERLENFYNQVKINKVEKMTLYDAMMYTLKGAYGGFCLWNTNDLEKFLNSLNLNNNSNKKFTSEDMEKMYCHLILRESLKLWKKYGIKVTY